MRFSILHLLLLMAVSSVYLALVLALPAVLGVLVLSLLSFIAPAIYIGGVVYSRRGWRAFWIGTMSCGMLPSIISAYMVVVTMATGISSLFALNGDRTYLYMLAACQMVPFFGGMAVVVMRRIFKPTRSLMPECCLGD